MPFNSNTLQAAVIAALFAVTVSFGQPTLSTPVNGAANQPLSETVTWNALSGASSYMLQVDVSTTFSAPLLSESGLSATSELITGLSAGMITYYWRVNATIGSVVGAWSAVWSFSTVPNAPAMPTLNTPANGGTAQSTLGWNPVSGATSYTLQISGSSTFSNFIFNQSGISTASESVVGGYAASSTYYWRVNALNAGGTSAWSSVWSFTTSVIPTLSSPANGAVNQPVSLTLTWNSMANAGSYTIDIFTTSDLSTSFGQGSSTTTQFVPNTFAYSTTYYWEVNSAASNGVWSSAWHFTTAGPPPAAPVLSLPANNTGNLGTSVTLTWNTAATATSYAVQLSTSATFANFVVNKTGITTLTSVTNGLALNTTYYWQANATNIGGTSAWSGVWSFSTVNGIPGAPTLLSPTNSAITSLKPTFSWGLVIDASSYGLQISNVSNFATTVFGQTGLASNTLKDSLASGIYYWRVNATNAGGTGAWSGAWLFAAAPVSVLSATDKSVLPSARMENGMLTYGLDRQSPVAISIYTVSGRKIPLLDQVQSAGSYRISLKGLKLSNGLYIVRFKAGDLERELAVPLTP